MVLDKVIMDDGYNTIQPPNYSGYVVIGAGLPRTGTMSMRSALGILLEGKCYHMLSVATSPGTECDFWIKAMEGKVSDAEWVEFLQGRGFRAGVDFPASWFYKELMRVFPDAKVVLTLRDPVRWYHSVKSTISLGYDVAERSLAPKLFCKMLGHGKVNKVSFGMASLVPESGGFRHGMLQAVAAGEDAAVEYYNRWTEEVKRTVPKERLLVFEVKEGWGPLCRFLDLPAPSEPFPRINDTATVIRMINRLWVASHVFFLGVVPICLGGIAYALSRGGYF